MTDRESTPSPPFWVFAYGSLMWRPGFDVAETQPAVLEGHHRAPCVLSVRYRGTPERPGLVVGLRPGGYCVGRAHRAAPGAEAAARAHVTGRELGTGAYAETTLPVALDDGRTVQALCFVVTPGHPQVRDDLSRRDAAALVAQGMGPDGSARDYLAGVIADLAAMGVSDPELTALLAAVDDPDHSDHPG